MSTYWMTSHYRDSSYRNGADRPFSTSPQTEVCPPDAYKSGAGSHLIVTPRRHAPRFAQMPFRGAENRPERVPGRLRKTHNQGWGNPANKSATGGWRSVV